MPSLYDLKPAFQRLLMPLVGAFHRAGMRPNAVTLAAVVASVGYGVWMSYDTTDRLAYRLLPLFMFARMALNAIDGMLARHYNLQTRTGAVLNELGDVVSDVALILPFALLPELHPAPVVAAVVAALLTEFCGVLGLAVGGRRSYAGPLGKSDRALVFGALGLVLGVPGILAPLQPHLDRVLVLVDFLLLLTIWNRVRSAMSER